MILRFLETSYDTLLDSRSQCGMVWRLIATQSSEWKLKARKVPDGNWDGGQHADLLPTPPSGVPHSGDKPADEPAAEPEPSSSASATTEMRQFPNTEVGKSELAAHLAMSFGEEAIEEAFKEHCVGRPSQCKKPEDKKKANALKLAANLVPCSIDLKNNTTIEVVTLKEPEDPSSNGLVNPKKAKRKKSS